MLFSSDSTSLEFSSTGRRCLRLAMAGMVAVLLTAASANALIYTYENTIGGTLSNATTPCANPLVRTFVIPPSQSFTVNRVAIGLNLTHPVRGQVQATLVAPNGALLQFITPSVADTNANFDILVSSNPEEALNDGDIDPVGEPFYSRTVGGPGAINTFYTGNSVGTWTLQVCDTIALDDGAFNRAYLMLASAATATPTCSSFVTYDWGLLGGPGNPNPTPLLGNPVTANGVTISQTSQFDHGGTASTGAELSFAMRTTTNGNHAGYYSLIMNAATVAGTQDNESVGLTSVLGFSVPVRDLTFQLLDVDQQNASWEDQIRLIGTDTAGNRIPYTITPFGGATTDLAGDLAEGDTSADNTATTGNLAVVFNGAVSSLSLIYSQGDNPAADNNQMVIGLSDFNECAYDYGDAPTTYGSAGQVLGNRTLYLGSIPPDGESVTPPAPNSAATTDDTTYASGTIDDENGVSSFPNSSIVAGGTYTVTGIVVNNTTGAPANLCGWVDFDTNGQGGGTGDGRFGADEGACISIPSAGPNANCTASGTTFTCSMTWTVPADYVFNSNGSTYARFRLSNGALTTSNFNDPGVPSANPGEVEDYQISSATLPVTIAWVETVPSAGGMSVRFATATETANAGFRIWGTDGRGQRSLLASLKSSSTDSFVPQHYETTIRGGRIAAIEIEDLSLFGQNRLHGPFALGTTFGVEPEADAIDWAAIRSESGTVTALDRMRSAEAAGSDGGAQLASFRVANPVGNSGLLLVREEGIHRVTYEQLFAAGIDLTGVPAAKIELVDDGAGVPRHIQAPGGVFGPGGYIEFVARPRLTLASPVDAYVLKIDGAKAIGVASNDPGKGGPAVTTAIDRYHPDRLYSPASPNGDPWYDERVLSWGAPATTSRSFDLPDLANGSVSLRLRVWGYGDLDGATPDHHVIVKVNGTEVADHAFDGLTSWEPTIDVTGAVNPGANTLELLVPGDAGYAFDYIAVEGFEVSYPRATVARGGRFRGTVERQRAFRISGFADTEPVAVWKPSGSTWTRQLRQPARGTVVAAGGAGDAFAAAESLLYRPGIVAGVPAARLRSSAEYLIVTHPSFVDSMDDLVALEESRGFITEVVTTDEIFSAYSDHASSAAAVKRFLSASLAQGNLRYVLLVGADTADPYDHLGLGSISFVPTDYKDYVPVAKFSPTDESLVDRQNDGVGDVPIGRLPVRTPAELEAVVAKLYGWEAAIGSGQASALLAAGLSDGARSLSTLNEAYSSSLPGWNTVLAQVDDSGSAQVRQQVLDALNAGAYLVSYVGHSSSGQWDLTPILKWQDAASLSNADLPSFITAWSCWNSYFVEPTVESLSARLLLQPNAGAAGVIGATTLTSEPSHRALGTLFFARVNAGAVTVGEAFHGAKQDLAAQGGAGDAIYGMTLLGDPAMSLPQSQ